MEEVESEGGRRVVLQLELTVDADWTADSTAAMVRELGALLSREAWNQYGKDAGEGYVGPRLVFGPKYKASVGSFFVSGDCGS